ncbi:MAG: hypothetical protein M3N11_08140, partial [Actinomycetota bacterium]|nr:hypothetical protein [Actinomycetota bacterium]
VDGATTQRRATEVLGAPTRAEMPGSTPPAPARRSRTAVAVAVLAVVLAVGLAVLARDDTDPAAPGAGDAPATRDDRIPEPLDRALRELEEAVRP